MSTYAFWASKTGAIIPASQSHLTAQPPDGYTLFTLTETDTPTADEVWANSSLYTYTSGTVTGPMPYFSLTSSIASGIITVEATLNNPPTTLPTDTTLNVAGTSIFATLSAAAPYTTSATFTVDSLVQSQMIDVSVTATGVKSASVNIGGNASPSSLQVIAPTTAGDPYRVTTTSKAYAAEAYLSQSNADLAAILGSLQTLVQMLIADVYGKGGIRESLAQASYTQVPFDAAGNEQNALADMQANLIPSIGWLLSNVYPSGGTQDYHYAATKTHLPSTTSAAQAYAKFVAETPNLA